MSTNDSVLVADSRLFMSKTTCNDLQDKPADNQLLSIACGAKELSLQIAASEKEDDTRLCDKSPKSKKVFPGESTATLPMFYATEADSAYVAVRQAGKKGDNRYFRWELQSGGGEEFIAYVDSHDITAQAKGTVMANMNLILNSEPEQMTISTKTGA